jgi:hypothetical protein
MDLRLPWSFLSAIAIVTLAAPPVASQGPSSGSRTSAPTRSKTAAAMRTAWGHPDLQGIWSFKTITPLERPAQFAGKEFLTEQEAVQLERQAVLDNSDEDRPKDAAQDVATAYNEFWMDRGDKIVRTRRSSLIIDPPDGRLPALTAEGKERVSARATKMARPAHGPEDRSQFERCVSRGLPRLPGGYNQNLQLLQTPEYVAIVYEMMREPRIIPLDGRGHVGSNIRQWLGDSRGRWEGDTLVVETTNFNRQHEFRGATENLRLVERFRRLDRNTIDYQVTATDPSAWTASWTAAIPLVNTGEPMYEYACHEGNYGMPNLLMSARAEDRAAATSGR